MIKKLLVLIAIVALPGFQATYGQLKISEIRVRSNDTSTNTDFIEIQGTPGATVPSGTRIIAFSKGGDTDSGVLTGRVQSIAGLTIPDDGYLSICRSDAVITDIDLVDSGINWQSFQNLTFLLVENASFIASGTDLDADDDGTIDNVVWESILDGVALTAHDNATLDPATRAWDYSQDPALGSGLTNITGANGSSTWHHIQRDPLTDAWQVGDSIGSYADLIYDSHSAPNSLIANDGESKTVDVDLTVYNVIIKGGGSLTVAPGATLTVLNKVINNGVISVQSGGSLLETSGVFEGNGSFTFERKTQHAADALRHSLVGSPVTGFNIETLSAAAYYSYNEGDALWEELASNPVMSAGQAYSVVGKTNLLFEGTPNSGTIDVTSTASAYKLLANPYPCAIDISAFFAANSSELEEQTIWLWNDGGSDGGQRGQSDYLTVNSLGEAQSGSTGTKSSSSFIDGSLGAMQGFFVSTSASGTSLTFNNDMKQVGNNTDEGFFRSAQQEVQSLKLTLSNENSFSETLLAFTPSASHAFDNGLDATKVKGNSKISLSALIEGEPYVILANPILQGSDELIVVEFEVADAGNYNFALSDLEHIPEGYHAILSDSETNHEIDLMNGVYSFYSEAVTASRRFTLRLTESEIVTASKDLLRDDFLVYKSDFGLNIKAPFEYAPVAIYDMSGAVLMRHDQVNFADGKAHLIIGLKPNHVYVIKVGNLSTKYIQH